jgi:hypothetical protein
MLNKKDSFNLLIYRYNCPFLCFPRILFDYLLVVLNDDALCTVGGTATIKGFTPLASPEPDNIISRFFNANEGVSPIEFRRK